MTKRECVKCGGRLRSNTGPDQCWRCRNGLAATGRAPDGDEIDVPVVRRTQAVKPPPPADPTPDADAGPNPIKEFHQLAEALGLDPTQMLEDHCSEWVTRTRARALAEEPESTPPPKLEVLEERKAVGE